MKTDSGAFLPKARSEEIITRQVEGELLIYDQARDSAHCLNETAAAVWKLCDGQSSVGAIALKLQKARRQKGERSEQWEVRQGTSENKIRSLSGSEGVFPSEENIRTCPHVRVVWLALDQLRGSYLLEEDETNEKTFWPLALSGIGNMSRREAIRRIGLGTAIALPLVISITAPTPAEAAVSCGATCHPCNSPVDCCGVCSSVSVPGCGPTTPRCT